MAKKKPKDRIPYTPEEIEFIKSTPLIHLKDLAFSMNRSYSSVRRKKWALEHKEQDVAAKKRYLKRQYEALTGGKRKYDYWTPREIILIMESVMTDTELAIELGRSVQSIQIKRHRLVQAQKQKKKKK